MYTHCSQELHVLTNLASNASLTRQRVLNVTYCNTKVTVQADEVGMMQLMLSMKFASGPVFLHDSSHTGIKCPKECVKK